MRGQQYEMTYPLYEVAGLGEGAVGTREGEHAALVDQREYKYTPSTFEDLGFFGTENGLKTFIGLFLGLNLAYVPTLLQKSHCQDFYNSGDCTDVEWFVVNWVAYALISNILGHAFIFGMAFYSDENGQDSQLIGDFVRRYAITLLVSVAYAMGSLVALGSQGVNGVVVAEQFKYAVIFSFIMMIVMGAVVRGGTVCAAWRDPLVCMLKPHKNPASFAVGFALLMNLVCYYMITVDGGVQGWMDLGEERRMEVLTPAFGSTCKNLATQMMMSILQIAFVQVYTSPSFQKKYLVFCILNSLFSEIMNRFLVTGMLTTSNLETQTFMNIVSVIVFVYGIFAPEQEE